MRERLFGLVSVFALAPALAQDGGEVARCTAIEDAHQRLACYDELFRDSARPAPAPSATSSPPPPATVRSSEEGFGKDVEAERAKARAEEEQKERVRELRAKITKVDLLRSGAYVLTLDNGQVWRQSEPKLGLQFKEGDPILIRAASLGSYLLQHENGKTTTRVTRAR